MRKPKARSKSATRVRTWRQWRTLYKDKTVEQLANLAKTTNHILSDLNLLEWGVSPRLYALKGDSQDLAAELIGTMPNMDPSCFVNAYDEGWRVPDDTEGLVYIFETFRHFNFEEILETPEAEAQLRRHFSRVHPELVKNGEVQSKRAYRRFYDDEIQANLPPPQLVPLHMRKNMRAAVAILKGGYGFFGVITQGKDDFGMFVFNEDKIGPVANTGALYQLLHNIRPEDDAVGNVNNYKILQEIEALG